MRTVTLTIICVATGGYHVVAGTHPTSKLRMIQIDAGVNDEDVHRVPLTRWVVVAVSAQILIAAIDSPRVSHPRGISFGRDPDCIGSAISHYLLHLIAVFQLGGLGRCQIDHRSFEGLALQFVRDICPTDVGCFDHLLHRSRTLQLHDVVLLIVDWLFDHGLIAGQWPFVIAGCCGATSCQRTQWGQQQSCGSNAGSDRGSLRGVTRGQMASTSWTVGTGRISHGFTPQLGAASRGLEVWLNRRGALSTATVSR